MINPPVDRRDSTAYVVCIGFPGVDLIVTGIEQDCNNDFVASSIHLESEEPPFVFANRSAAEEVETHLNQLFVSATVIIVPISRVITTTTEYSFEV
jgi:hypothetical protein